MKKVHTLTFARQVLSARQISVFLALTIALTLTGSTLLGPGFAQQCANSCANPGCLDASFGNCGTVLTDASHHPNSSQDLDGASRVVVQSDSKLLATGMVTYFGSGPRFAALRYNVDGTLDDSFGNGGVVITQPEDQGILYNLNSADAACLQRVTTEFGVEERLVQAGIIRNSNGWYGIAVVRYTPAGDLDTTFNGSGKQVIFFASADVGARACVVQSDGKIVLAGDGGRGWNFVRLNSDGMLDTSFGSGGRVYIPFANIADSFPWDVIIQQTPAGERILGGGRAYANGKTGYDFGLIRLTLSGALDSSFGTSGKVITDFYKQGDQAFQIAIDPLTGDIIAGGSALRSSKSQSEDFALARYNRNGSLLSKVTSDISGDSDRARGMAIQWDGKIVLGGQVKNSSGGWDFAIARYLSSGALDNTFGSGGKVTKDIAGYTDFGLCVALQQVNGVEKIIIGGTAGVTDTTSPNYGYNIVLARYLE